MNTPTTETIYEQLGICKEVWAFGQKTEEKLKERNCRECYAVSGNEAAAKQTGIGGKRIV